MRVLAAETQWGHLFDQKVSKELNVTFRYYSVLKEKHQTNWIRSPDQIAISISNIWSIDQISTFRWNVQSEIELVMRSADRIFHLQIKYLISRSNIQYFDLEIIARPIWIQFVWYFLSNLKDQTNVLVEPRCLTLAET